VQLQSDGVYTVVMMRLKGMKEDQMVSSLRVILLNLLLFIFSAGSLAGQDYNMGSDATQGDYGWFHASVTTIDLNGGAEAPFDGRMIQWRLNNAFAGGTAIMKVFRDSADTYVLIAEDSRTITGGSGLNTFPVDIMVEQGDLLGIYVSDYDVVMCTTGGSMVMHNGNAGTSLKSEWISEGFTLSVDALVDATGIEEEENERSPVSLAGWPNPSGPGFRIECHLRKGDGATLCIYDITGKVVRHFMLDPSSSSFPAKLVWNGRDASGELVPDGIYFYQVKAGNEIVTGSMIFIR
jgi:hypothetical protein